jgi:integrase
MGRLSTALTQVSVTSLRPTPREMAFVRACVQGVEPADAWARYLAHDRTAIHPKPGLVLRRLLDELRSLARAHGRPGVAALLVRDPAAVRGPANDRLSLEAYRDQQPLDFYSEAELADLYRSEFGGSTWRDPARRRDRLRTRLLEALQWLGSLSVRMPLPEDPVASWLEPSVAGRLAVVGVRTLGDLSSWISTRGFRWHRPVRGIGPRGAARIVRWLQDHEPTVGALPAHALLADRQIDKAASTPTPCAGIVPLERFVAPQTSDGSRGSNRAPFDQCRIQALGDADAVRAWLAQWREGAATWRAYRKEAERFMLWAVVERDKALSSLGESDCAAYREFIARPDPRWTAPRRTPRWSDQWRPFEGPLAPRSATLAASILRAMLEWLVRQGYLRVNPWVTSPAGEAPGAKGARVQSPLRALSTSQLEEWRRWLDGRPPSAAIDRLRFIVDFTASTGLRRTELAAARLDDLLRDPGEKGPSAYRLRVRSRRVTGREVPLSASAVLALQTYLRSRGLSIDAGADAPDAPLVASLRSGSALTDVRLYEIVSIAMKRCASDLAAREPHTAHRMSAASIQWLRHSCGIQAAGAGAGASEVQALLGHARAASAKVYFEEPRLEGDVVRRTGRAEMI